MTQYVTWLLSARSAPVTQRTWGAPGQMVVGMTVHTTCHGAGQPNVSQRRVS